MKKRTEGHISQRSVVVIIVEVLRAKVILEMQQQCASHEQNSRRQINGELYKLGRTCMLSMQPLSLTPPCSGPEKYF